MFDSLDDAINFGKQRENDGGLPFFRWESIENKKTEEFEDVAWVMIINKGDSKTIIEREKRPEDEKRWPDHWKAFVEGSEVPLDGIPLEDFPAMSPADIANCHRYHIRTVEDLANYPDGQLKNISGRGTSLKKKAAKFIEYRKGPDVDELKNRIEELEKLVGDNIKSVSKRATGNGVSKSRNTRGKQQSRRKSSPTVSKDSSKASE